MYKFYYAYFPKYSKYKKYKLGLEIQLGWQTACLECIKPWVQTSAPQKPGMVEQACDPQTEKVEARRSVQVHPWLHREFHASWDTRKPVSKTKK